MEHHEVFVAAVFNRLIVWLASLFGYHLSPEVLPAHVVMVIIVGLTLIVLSLLARKRFNVEDPGAVQQFLELWAEGTMGLARDIIGGAAVRFFPLLGGLFLYILLGNVLGMLPGFMSPTSNLNVTGSCAIVVFFYYNSVGFRTHGFLKYLGHFAGPSLAIAPLLFVIEIISHFARPVSLSVRLFGNIYAEETIIGTLNGMFPFVLSLPVMGLALFASTIQAFIFIVLTMVYLGGALEHGPEEEGPEPSRGLSP